MTEAFHNFSSFLLNIVSAFIAIEYIHCGFQKKKTKLAEYLLFFCGFIAYFSVLVFFNHRKEFEGIAGLLYGLIVLLYAMVALKGALLDKLVLSFVWVLIALMSSYLIYVFASLITGKSLNTLFLAQGSGKFYLSIGALLLKFLLGRIVLVLKKRKQLDLRKTEDWVLTATLFTIFFLVIGMFGLDDGQLAQKSKSLLSLSMLTGCCFIILFLGYFYIKLSDLNEKRLNAEYLLKYRENEKENYKTIREKDQEIRKFRHDLSGTLFILHHLVENGQMNDALQYIEGLDSKIKTNLELPQDTGNDGLNAALIHMILECQEKNIPFQYHISGPLNKLDIMDTNVLFSNLLSNAMEACEKVNTERSIELEIREMENFLYCRLENSIECSVLQSNPELKTTKPDKESHGLGMERIREMIEKYHGEYSCTEENNNFIQSILLKII